jgi:PAS domain S-box-containing protein
MTEIGPQSQAGYTLRCKDPVVVEDLRTEARFRGPSLLTDHGVVSGVSVIVGDLESPYGVLGAHTTRRREFTQHDVHFLQGVAHLVAAAAQRSAGEEALRESEERFRALFENSLDAILLTVPNGRILAANREACRMFQHTEEELRALGREGIVDLSDPRLQPLLAERARTGRARGELRFLRRDGSAFPGTVSSGGFRTRRGDVCSSITVHDLTAAKQAEARMAEQLAELRRWHDATLGREQRILELKAEVNALLKERGCAARYQSAEPEQAAWPAPPAELGTRERD